MQHQRSRTTRARILTGAIVGAIISLGVVADSASAAAPKPISVDVGERDSGTPSTGVTVSMRSGIRW
jgi:hypothetical protein